MFWHCSQKDMKVLLLATMFVFSGYALLLAGDWAQVSRTEVALEAQTVGVYAGVQANETNVLVAKLDAWEEDLEARELALGQATQKNSTDTRTLFLVTIIGSGLLGLILLNFYLDSTRRRSLAVSG